MSADRDIEIFIVKALAQYQRPMTDDSLRGTIVSAFSHLALTAGDLGARISAVEDKNLIAGTNDELLGKVWLITPKGKIRAQS